MPTRQAGTPTSELFQALVENSSDALALVDASGAVLYSSHSSERLLGYPSAERVGHSAFEFIHPDDERPVKAAFADLIANPGVPMTREFRVRHRDGTWIDVEAVAVNRLNEPAIGGIVVNYRNVTARRCAERALRASEERLRYLVDTAQDLIYDCDVRGCFTHVNATAVRLMQYSEAELVGRHYLTLIRPDYRPLAEAFYTRQFLERTRNTYFEFPTVTKGGDVIWVGQNVHLVGDDDRVVSFQAIARDITRQKTAEDLLRRSEARYRSLIQGAAYGIYRTTLDGVILDANPALAAMLGYESASDLTGRSMAELYVNPEERQQLVDRYGREGQAMGPVEVRWRRRDGASIVVRLATRAVEGEDGVSGFEGIAEDVTARRAIEEQLRQAQKMEAVGRLARGVAHDFNNLLAAIVGCSDLLAMRLKPDDPSRIDAEEIRRAAERGAALTKQLLAFSRRQALEPQVFDLHAVAHGLEQILRRLAGDDVALTLQACGAPPRVKVEPGQIEQILLNLVVNARDAMPDGGAIDIRIETVALGRDPAHAHVGLPPGDYALLTVADTGHGMDPETQRHVFEPFFTTKDPAKGTGLGLSIVYSIAKDAGGMVTFTTSSDGPKPGTTFQVFLPVADL